MVVYINPRGHYLKEKLTEEMDKAGEEYGNFVIFIINEEYQTLKREEKTVVMEN